MHTNDPYYTPGHAPPTAYAAPPPDRDPIVDFAFRWWWLLALGVALGIAGAIAYGMFGPSAYTSTALIQVTANSSTDPTDNAGQARSATTNFAAEGESTRMFDLVSQALVGSYNLTTDDLLSMARSGRLDISQQRGTNFVSVEVTDPDPDRARAIADTFATVLVEDVNTRANTQVEARSQQLLEQIDFTRQQMAAAQLFDRQRQLKAELRDQQQRLLTLQATYQQEHARQLEFDQLAEDRDSDPTIAEARANFETIMVEQIQDVEQNIASINEELTSIQASIAALPADTDPAISTAYASAYATQLSQLTAQYVREQISSYSAGPPLVQFGAASTPLKVQRLRKNAFYGIALGGAAAAGCAFAIEQWRKRRPQDEVSQPMATEMNEHALTERLSSLLNTAQDVLGHDTPGTQPAQRSAPTTSQTEPGSRPSFVPTSARD